MVEMCILNSQPKLIKSLRLQTVVALVWPLKTSRDDLSQSVRKVSHHLIKRSPPIQAIPIAIAPNCAIKTTIAGHPLSTTTSTSTPTSSSIYRPSPVPAIAAAPAVARPAAAAVAGPAAAMGALQLGVLGFLRLLVFNQLLRVFICAET